MPWQKTRADRQRDQRVYGTAEYKRKRRACLERAGYRCEIRIEGVCTVIATQADHELGAENDPHHNALRAACEPCHKQVTATQGGGYRANRGGADPEPRPRTKF